MSVSHPVCGVCLFVCLFVCFCYRTSNGLERHVSFLSSDLNPEVKGCDSQEKITLAKLTLGQTQKQMGQLFVV